jgi:hypothetical protein
MAEGSVSVELSVDEQKALKALTSLTQKFESFGKDAEKAMKKSDIAFGSFVGNLASSAVQKGFSLITSGIGSVISSIDDLISASAEQEKTLNDFNTALAVTGKYSKKASQDFQDFASTIQSSTGIGDDSIIALGAQIQNIAKLSVDELKKATYATVQFSSALGVDLNSAGTIVGKALEGNVATLAKYGIKVKKGADETQTFNNVIQALSGLSGTAESKLNTFAGSTNALKERFGDLKESLGAIILNNPALVKAIKILTDGILNLQTFVQENRMTFVKLINGALIPFIEIGATSAQIILEIAHAFSTLNSSMKIGGINSQLEDLKKSLDDVREKSANMIDIQTGERVKTLYEKTLEEQIASLEKSLVADVTYYNQKEKVFEGFSQKVKEIQTGLVNSLNESESSGQNDRNTKYLEKLNLRNQLELEAKTQHNNTMLLLEQTQLQTLRDAQAEYDLQQQLANDANFQFLVQNLGREEALREVARAQELAKTGGHNASILSLRAARVKAEQNQIFALQRYEDLSNRQRLDNLKSTFGIMANLQQSSSKELFMIGKASALAIATVDGIQAIQKALASAPPPFNYALAAAVGVVQASNLAKIASTKQGMENGGIVGGNSTFGDKVSMQLNSREMVLNRQQQTKLFNDINNGGGSGSVVTAINNLGDRIARMNIIVQANSREIARLVRDEREAGFAV